jgi:signal transduction histidine kinase
MDRHASRTGSESEATALSSALLMHGLWQPVSTLHALAMALTRGWGSLDDGERLQMANDIEAETLRLRELAEDLTTLSLIQTDGYRPALRREPVVDLLRDAAASVGELNGRLRVRVEPSAIGAAVLGDRGRILQVLKAFALRADRCSDGMTTVIVRSARHANGLAFEVEYRPDPAATVAAGSGRWHLTLDVSRRLVEAHGGRIDVRSAGDLAVIAFALPVAESEAA